MNLDHIANELRLQPGKRIKLADFDPGFDGGLPGFKETENLLITNRERLMEFQTLLFAERKRSLLIVLQGMDSSGKDGVMRHVMHGVNPKSCTVTSFKTPTIEEIEHDFLWRVHKACPRKGHIGIFDRSHYGDVLVVRVRGLVEKSVWKKRYDQINDFERMLTENGTTILKFFLNISKDEQRKRLQKRLDDPTKNWKMSLSDIHNRELWDSYMDAYEAVMNKCNTDYAPWYIISSDKKWFRNLMISHIINHTLESMNMQYPRPEYDPSKIIIT